MFTSYLVKKKGYRTALSMINMLSIILAPFYNTHLGVIDGGAGSEGDQEKLLKEIEGRVAKLVSDATKDNIKKADIDKEIKALNDAIATLTNEQIDALKKSVDELSKKNEVLEAASKAQGLEIAKMKNVASPEIKMTFREAMKQAILEKKDTVLVQKNDDNGERLSLKDYFNEKGNKTSPVFTVKAAVDMLQSNIVGNYVNNIRLTQLDPNRVGIPLTVYPHVLDVFPQKGITRPFMSLLVVYTYWDGSGTKTGGSASGKSSFLLKTVEFKAFNIATYFSLSDETLDDLEEVLDEISVTAPDKVLDQIDSKVFADAGDGSTDIQGLFVGGTTCTDFVASTYATTVAGANLIDLIAKMKLAVRKNKYKANFVALNATDIDNIQSIKDQLDNSIMDRRLVFDIEGNLVRIAGLRVIENDAITANTCVVGDSSQAMIGIRKAMTLEIGLNGSDFTEGQKTVRLGVRLAFGVRDKAAFQYSSNMTTDRDTIAISGS